MTVGGVSYRLTKHGRKRFLERTGHPSTTPDVIILSKTVGDVRAIWFADRDQPGSYRLVTFLTMEMVDNDLENNKGKHNFKEVLL